MRSKPNIYWITVERREDFDSHMISLLGAVIGMTKKVSNRTRSVFLTELLFSLYALLVECIRFEGKLYVGSFLRLVKCNYMFVQ